MNKLQELQAKKKSLADEAQAALDASKTEEAKKLLNELDKVERDILQETINEAKGSLEQRKQTATSLSGTDKKNASFIRAALKKMNGKNLTEAENALLMPSTQAPNGENGEAYLLPVDFRTRIVQKIREYGSLRDTVGVFPVSAKTGSIPVEGFDTLTELVDFEDGNEIAEDTDIKFTSVTFTLKTKGAIIALSNTLLALTDEELLEVIAILFARKAVISENKAAIGALKANKTAYSLADIHALILSLETDIDPAALDRAKILTNQSGYGYLVTQKDENGHPLLQSDIANPAKKHLSGKFIKVLPDSELPNVDGKAPVFYGDLEDGAKILDLMSYLFAASNHAGFKQNVTIARIVAEIGAAQFDGSDRCYRYGLLPTAGVGVNTVNSTDSEHGAEGAQG